MVFCLAMECIYAMIWECRFQGAHLFTQVNENGGIDGIGFASAPLTTNPRVHIYGKCYRKQSKLWIYKYCETNRERRCDDMQPPRQKRTLLSRTLVRTHGWISVLMLKCDASRFLCCCCCCCYLAVSSCVRGILLVSLKTPLSLSILHLAITFVLGISNSPLRLHPFARAMLVFGIQ